MIEVDLEYTAFIKHHIERFSQGLVGQVLEHYDDAQPVTVGLEIALVYATCFKELSIELIGLRGYEAALMVLVRDLEREKRYG